ncbi:hypothetical protein F8388_026527 [Cannabis sativa]|uniref:PHD finger protein ALFIN-LIKE n=1 Tax=Cannabis sativa TaxID=3483 RepID=A0A7J6E9J8_CANSA|nr:hypothetical protein F8388_026527 [Cannabis sativa]KAF4361974.1 hypothetical protein G4B88_029486 [Cannabis sativa]
MIVPPKLFELALGINFARDGMQEKGWLSLVAVHSNSWLLAIAFYFGARFGFGKSERKRLFQMINDLQTTIFEVLTGIVNKQSNEQSTTCGKGNSVQATLYEDSIDLFRDKLKLHRTYYISNAYVKHAPKSHTLTNNAFQWTINSSTLIEEAKETEVVITIPQRSLVSFSELQNYVKTNTEIVWNSLLDAECAEIRKIIKNTPILLAKHLKVGSYKGISLATNAHSSLLLEPKIPAVDCEVNKEFLLQQSSKTDDSSSSSATPLPPGDFKDLSTITSTTNKSDHYWVKASITLTNFQQRFAYIACNKCNISTGVELEETFDCIKGREGKGVGRSCVQVHLKDNTTALPATLFGSIANKFLNCSTAQLLQQITENGNEDIKNIINPCSFVVSLRLPEASRLSLGLFYLGFSACATGLRLGCFCSGLFAFSLVGIAVDWLDRLLRLSLVWCGCVIFSFSVWCDFSGGFLQGCDRSFGVVPGLFATGLFSLSVCCDFTGGAWRQAVMPWRTWSRATGT